MWPWSRRETRATSYTDAVVSHILRQAGGQAGELGEVAALEICAGLYGRTFASAVVKSTSPMGEPVTPATLEMVGRQLMRRGEVLFEIVVEDGELRLQPCSGWSVTGGPSPREWLYELTSSGPSRTTTRTSVSPDRVVHLRYASSPQQPWKGQSPVQVAAATSTIMANIEHRLGEELSAQVGVLLPIPDGATEENKNDLKADLAGLKGKIALAPTVKGGWGGGPETAPRNDWQTMRLGANPPQVLDLLRTSAARHVLAACGVPIEVMEASEGTGAREAYRRFLHSSVVPVARLVTMELRDKLNAPDLELNFDGLFASDLSGRARAFQSMVGAGMDITKAAALAGLMEPEE